MTGLSHSGCSLAHRPVVPEFGAVAELIVMLNVQSKASEYASKVTPEFTAVAAEHKNLLVVKFIIMTAKPIMFNLVYNIRRRHVHVSESNYEEC